MEVKFLNKENTKVEKTEGGFLNVTIDGKLYENIQLVRTFPFTAPNQYISLQLSDEDAEEIGIIEDLEKDFSGAEKDVLLEQLAIRYFTPVIKKVISVKDQAGCSYFEVETDAGPCKFVIRSNENAFIKLTENRVLIEDLENNRYEIPDLRRLTTKERKKLDIFL